MPNIAVLASFNMDLVMRAERRPGAGETLQGEFAMHLGGKGFNQAVAARRLGAEVAVAGRVGDDEYGRMFLDALDREGIDRRAVVVDPVAGTGVASIIVEPDGTNSIVQAPRANRRVRASDASRFAQGALTDGAVGMMTLETSDPGAMAFAQAAREAGATTLLNAAPAASLRPKLLAPCDVLVVNEIEAATLLGQDVAACDAAAMARSLRAAGPRIVVVTLGARGAVARAGEELAVTPAFAVPVVDSTGAGDAFCAALAVRIEEGAALVDAMRFANAAGAVACTRAGAELSMPHRREVEALLRDGATRA